MCNKYDRSDFSDIGLDFDSEKKLIYEHDQCCAGTKHIITTYKVVNNHMVLVEKKCLEYNEEGELVDAPCEE